ncbi:hypothetical protein ACQPW1_22730 [Nocardia sp. CA-128927]|uniref:hypothetical protein n=1 Tax=Nocardia sp. CA-128927 TaxID=3239975 RepID=UPI003D954299
MAISHVMARGRAILGVVSTTLAELAQQIRPTGTDSIALGGATVRYRSLNTSEYDPCMDWCAQLWMTVDAPEGYDDTWLCVGCVDFLTIRLGRELVGADLLDSYSQAAVEFSPLFDGVWLDDAVQQQFDATPVNDIIIVLSAELAPPVRGHQLGAWMISEITARMLSSHDGMVLVSPVPDQTDPLRHPDQLARTRFEVPPKWWTGGYAAEVAARSDRS